jgi:thymidine kinase
MGLYDTIDNIKAYCPKCGNEITNSWQTKDFLSCMDHYKNGDEIPDDRIHKNWVEIHTICHECNLFVSLHLNVIGGLITDEII